VPLQPVARLYGSRKGFREDMCASGDISAKRSHPLSQLARPGK
jgi:hypothetical protein